MLKINLFSITLLIAGLLAIQYLPGCASSQKRLPMPDELFARGYVAESVDPDQLARGRALAVTECSACHRFYWPQEYPPDAWPDIIQKKHIQISLNETQRSNLTEYFVAASQVVDDAPDMEQGNP